MDVEVSIDSKVYRSSEFADVHLLGVPDIPDHRIDIDYSPIFARTRSIPTMAADFLLFAGAVYGADKSIVRSIHAADRWKREINLSIPLENPELWQSAVAELETCVSFLTGDQWRFSFSRASTKPYRKRANRRKRAIGFPSSPVASLFSGGLDSFVAAINLLENYPDSQVLLVSHYDGKVPGPRSDQRNALEFLVRALRAQDRTFSDTCRSCV